MTPWWVRDGLDVRAGRLRFAGRDAEEIARDRGTPLYLYDPARLEANLVRLREALDRASVRHQILYALKANRHPAFLSRLRSLATVGIDACSPNEVSLAIESGFAPALISYTGTNLSDRDLDRILAFPLVLNLDSRSAIRRVGARAPGRRIGLRVNPQVGAGYNSKLTYAGDKPTKLGIGLDQIEAALEEARRYRLSVTGLHFHIGSGWLRDGLETFLEAVRLAAELARRIPGLEYVNVGGGLGIPLQASDRPVDLGAYASGLARHLGPLGVQVFLEPGDFLVKDAAILLAEVVMVEDKAGTLFVGLDCGFNVCCLASVYHYHQEMVLCRAADAPPASTCTVAGHINEASDLFAEGHGLPEVREGDVLALLNVGGYAAAMTSYHCARPPAAELAL